MWPVVVGREIVAIAVGGGFVVISYVIGVRSSNAGAVLTRWFASIAAFVWSVTMVFHLLAAFTAFRLAPAVAVVAVLTIGALWSVGGLSGLQPALARDAVFVRRVARLLVRSRFRWIVLGFFACTLPTLLHALLVPALGWDALTYHVVKAGMWAQAAGRDSMIGPGPWAYYRNMLGGGEVFPAWALMLLRSDTLVTAIDVAQWFGLGFASLVLARRFGAREPLGSAAVGFLLVLPTIRLLVGSGYVETGLLMAMICGVVLALDAVRTGRAGLLMLAGAALGVASAAKMPALVIAGALLPVIVFVAARHFRWRSIAAGVLAFALAVAPWVVRSTLRTGLPFSPVPVDIAGVAMGAAPPELHWYMRRPAMRPYELGTELRVLKRVFSRPGTQNEALGFLAVVPLLFAFSRLGFITRRSLFAAVLVVVAIVADLSEFYDPGFSVIRHYWTESSSRFILPAVILLTLLSVAVRERSAWHARAYLGYLWAATFFNAVAYAAFGFSRASAEGAVIALGGIVVLVGTLLAIARWPRMALAGGILVAVVALTGLHALRDAFRNDLYLSDSVIYPVPRYWMGALRYVDDPLARKRIAVTSGPLQNLDNWFAAPLLGRALENEVVYVPTTADGRILHWDAASNNAVIRAASDMSAWTRRLHDQRVSDVLSFEPESVELEWMENHPEAFVRIDGEPHRWGLFAVKR